MSVSSKPRARREVISPVPSAPVSFNWWKKIPLALKILTIPALFGIALIILQVLNYRSLEQMKNDTRLVDIASRQRVLNERFQKEVRDTADGIVLPNSLGQTEDWQKTAELFNTTADQLIKGGDIIFNIDTGEHGIFDPIRSSDVKNQLLQQKDLMNQMVIAARAYLRAPAKSPEQQDRLEELTLLGNSLAKLTNSASKQLTADSEASLRQAIEDQRNEAIIAGILGVIVSAFVASQITSPLGSVMQRAREIGASDLRGEPLPVQGSDEVGQLSSAFNTMQEGLREVAAQAQVAAESLSAAAAEILASAQEQAAGSGEQAAAVQQTTTTMEEISRSGTQIAEKARQVASTAEAASAASEAGINAVQEASRSMDTIQQQVQTVAENVVSLSERTRAIGDIITTVNEIAEQSHLLALNAAIEAAGAGEQGRRFSVVADEMKHLADQSREATVQVRSILSDIQKQIHTAVMVTEESVKRTEDGKRQSDTAEATIRRMSGSIIDSVNAFQQIVAAANQQQIGFEQVTQAAQQIRAAVDQTTVGIRQMESAAVNVNQMSEQLRSTVEVYRL